jgi:selenocysteine lyase/cysteine desulfurase
MDRVFAQCPDEAATAQDDLLHRIVVSEHRDDNVALACAGRAVRHFRPLVAQFFGADPGTVVDEDAVACLQQVARHCLPHSAEAYKSDFHRLSAPQAGAIAYSS